MKGAIWNDKRYLSLEGQIVKHLPQVVQRRLPVEISVVAVSERESARLNRRYRKKRKPANVLSFLYDREYGEIIVCPALIRVEAKAQGNSFQYQMTWMIVHGMLHLAGVHHEKSQASAKMAARLEEEVLRKFQSL